jgi:RND family efflux transporter MFP subunit
MHVSNSGVTLSEENLEYANRRPQKSGRGLLLKIAVVAGLIFIAAAVGVTAVRIAERRTLAAETERLAVPTVAIIHPKSESPQDEVLLPANLQAFTESPIYARTNGYVRHWTKDIGSRVSKGELLAEIDTPEIDQELGQARAAREQAAAKLNIAKTSAERWQNLRKSDSVSQQEADERNSTLQQGQADLAAAEANVRRLEQLESFKHVYAPFSGVITKRNIDVGALINAGNGGTNRELFDIAQVDPLRVYVSVPQTYAPSIKPGMSAYISLNEFPDEKFEGKVTRSANAIDPATRTLTTEVDVPNPKGKLLPGSYAQIHLAMHVDGSRLTLPVNAVLFRGEGARTAVVDRDGRVRLKPLTIGRDYGINIEILSGLTAEDNVIINPADSLEEGQQVQVRREQPAQQAGK